MSAAIFTSIDPAISRIAQGAQVGPEYQRHCVATWAATNWPIFSINFPDEIAVLGPRHPEIRFIAVPRPDTAKGGPRICQVMEVIAAQNFQINVVLNGDVAISPRIGLVEKLRWGMFGDLMMSYRIDIAALTAVAGTPYDSGFDMFVISPAVAAAYGEREFRMGAPWWDFWLPILAAVQGASVFRFAVPAVYHLAHPVAWRDEFAAMFRIFERHLTGLLARAPAPLREPNATLFRILAQRAAETAAIPDEAERMDSLGKLAYGALLTERFFPLIFQPK